MKTYQQWIDEQKANLDNFAKFWKDGLEKHPEVFTVSEDCGDGDWQEQYDVWCCHDKPSIYNENAPQVEALIILTDDELITESDMDE